MHEYVQELTSTTFPRSTSLLNGAALSQQPVGEHLKYLVWAQGRPVACLAWSSAPRHLASRDRFIGWRGEARPRHIRLLPHHTRFLIPPWLTPPHPASHILGPMARHSSRVW